MIVAFDVASKGTQTAYGRSFIDVTAMVGAMPTISRSSKNFRAGPSLNTSFAPTTPGPPSLWARSSLITATLLRLAMSSLDNIVRR